jgi:hypothetical protein
MSFHKPAIRFSEAPDSVRGRIVISFFIVFTGLHIVHLTDDRMNHDMIVCTTIGQLNIFSVEDRYPMTSYGS